MNRNVLFVDAEDALATALQLMLWSRIRHLPVTHGGKLAGVLTERDILRYEAEHGGTDALSHRVALAASMPARFAHPDDALTEVMARMAADKIGCLPVLDKDELVGLLTVTDVLAYQVRRSLTGEPDETAARDLMTQDPVVVHANDKLSLAVERMAKHDVRHLPVVDSEERLCGILSDRDIRPVSSRRALDEMPVERVMSKSVISLPPNAPRSVLLDAFTTWHLSALPIVDGEERPIGMISYVDLLQALAP